MQALQDSVEGHGPGPSTTPRRRRASGERPQGEVSMALPKVGMSRRSRG